jgi:membrane protein implicated in regulation of membrane protease activity
MPFTPDWYFLGFLAPLVLGILIVLGLSLGIGHESGHGGGELHGDADGHEALSVLGFGRTPFLIVLMMLLLWFGGVGLVCWFFGVPALLALAIASVVSYGLSRVSAGAIAQLMPSLETTSVKARDFRGLSGVVTLEASPGKPGLAHVTKGGDIYQISFTCNEQLAKGQRVLIIDVNAEPDVYSVCLDPTDPRGNDKWKWL